MSSNACGCSKPQLIVLDQNMYEELVSIVRNNGARLAHQLIDIITKDLEGES